jgi:hypothetical protein
LVFSLIGHTKQQTRISQSGQGGGDRREKGRERERERKEEKEQFNTIYVPIKETPVAHSPQILPALSTIIVGATKTVLQGSTVVTHSGSSFLCDFTGDMNRQTPALHIKTYITSFVVAFLFSQLISICQENILCF